MRKASIGVERLGSRLLLSADLPGYGVPTDGYQDLYIIPTPATPPAPTVTQDGADEILLEGIKELIQPGSIPAPPLDLVLPLDSPSVVEEAITPPFYPSEEYITEVILAPIPSVPDASAPRPPDSPTIFFD
jgi:hypothetical protein